VTNTSLTPPQPPPGYSLSLTYSTALAWRRNITCCRHFFFIMYVFKCLPIFF
jgi:hypothetical protein